MLSNFILPLSMAFALLIWTLIFLWHINPRLKHKPLPESLEPFLFVHSLRYIGLMFLLPGVTSEVLDSRFANPAAYGDLIAALLALATIIAFRWKSSWALALAWIFNLWGLFDLFNAVVQGIRFVPDGHFGATYWIPATIVPFLLVSHGYMFIRLLAGKSNSVVSAQA